MTTLAVGLALIVAAMGLLAWAFPRVPRRFRR
jgi:hypothetical protein